MLRFLLRFVGLWLLAGALVAAVVDGAKSIASAAVVLTPLRDTWGGLSPASLEALQRELTGKLHAQWAWRALSHTVLGVPTWLVFGSLACVLIALGQKRKRESIMQYSA